MILVVGATGVLGLEICRQLRAKGDPVRALVRAGSEKEPEVRALGAEVVPGDLKDHSSLDAACAGVETVVTTATCTTSRRSGDGLRTVDRDGQLALVAAARRAGVRRFVYVSLSPNMPPTCDLVRFKREVEAAVRASGMAWTNLQPTAFMEIWLSPRLGWDLAGGRARMIGEGRHRASLISLADVAQFAVLAARGGLANRDVPLGGPTAHSPVEIVELCEKRTGRKFRVQKLPVLAARALSAVMHPFAPVDANLIQLGIFSAENDDVVDMDALAAEVPRRLTSLADHVARSMGDSPAR